MANASTVTVEALAMGVPVVCLDHCGFAEVVDESCGIRVPVTTPQQSTEGLARAILELAEDENRRRRLAEGALRRARNFSWESKVAALCEIYRSKTMKLESTAPGAPDCGGHP
jgi:glycosyltransferase involved in cell wall biosynthesis